MISLKRDKKCELCEGLFYLTEKHHIHSQSKGGSNSKHNIARVCPVCHSEIHLGIIVVEGRFFTNNGNIVIHRKYNEPSITGNKPECWISPQGIK